MLSTVLANWMKNGEGEWGTDPHSPLLLLGPRAATFLKAAATSSGVNEATALALFAPVAWLGLYRSKACCL